MMMNLRNGLLAFLTVFAVLATAACSQVPTQAPAEPRAPSNPLQGVWSMTTMTTGDDTINPSQPGLFLFTEGHYSAVYSLGADPRPLSATAFDSSSEEKIAQYETIIVNSGTYEISGSSVTFRPVVAKSPEFIGGHSTMDFQIEGDDLTLTVRGVVAADGASPPDITESSMKLRRLE